VVFNNIKIEQNSNAKAGIETTALNKLSKPFEQNLPEHVQK
jgi:hypothetical protein